MMRKLLWNSEHRFRPFVLLYVTCFLLVLTLVTLSLIPGGNFAFIAFPSQADVNVPSTRPHDAILLPAGAPKVVPAAWTFIPSRDQRNFKMNEEQCNKAFPELFREIERAADFWAGRGGIRLDEVDISWQKSSGILRVLIFDQQLFIVEKKWNVPSYDVSRALALLHSIQRAILTSPVPLPNIEFTFNVGDWPSDPGNTYPVWVLSRTEHDTSKWVMPDFGYWSWPLDVLGEYSEVRSRILREEPPWAFKKTQAVWRGATGTNPLRTDLMDAAKDKPWSDVKAIEWIDGKPTVTGEKGRALTITEHCNYRFVIHTEGHSYSGRTKYLLGCSSVSIIHKQDWIEPHSHLYVSSGPEQNIISVERNFTDLDHAMQQVLKDDALARRIAHNSIQVFRDRYLTPAAQTCYWRRMFYTWARISDFKPKLYIKSQDKGRSVWKMRAVPYESFVADLYDPSTLRDPIHFM